LSKIEKMLSADPKWSRVKPVACRQGFAEFARAAESWHDMIAAKLSADADAAMAKRLKQANAALMQVERALTRPQGLRGRPWYRNIMFAADERNSYAPMELPTVNEAIMAGDIAQAQREMADLAKRLKAAAKKIRQAKEAIEPAGH
jgi:N-acetylated-alpha-linked acidic dipeptidase